MPMKTRTAMAWVPRLPSQPSTLTGRSRVFCKTTCGIRKEPTEHATWQEVKSPYGVLRTACHAGAHRKGCLSQQGADGEWGVIWLGTERTRNGKEHDLPLVR